jgi:hemerythrin
MKKTLYIVWSEENEVGIPIIDEQHRGIISTINSLHYFMQTGKSGEIIKPILIMLEQYTIIHFNTEESLIEDAGYPDLENHRKLHDNLLANTRNFFIELNKSEDPAILLKFLKDWWLTHINVEDKKYVSLVKKKLNI